MRGKVSNTSSKAVSASSLGAPIFPPTTADDQSGTINVFSAIQARPNANRTTGVATTNTTIPRAFNHLNDLSAPPIDGKALFLGMVIGNQLNPGQTGAPPSPRSLERAKYKAPRQFPYLIKRSQEFSNSDTEGEAMPRKTRKTENASPFQIIAPPRTYQFEPPMISSRGIQVQSNLSSTRLDNAHLETVNISIAEYREAKKQLDMEIAELHEDKEKFKQIISEKNNEILVKDYEIAILKSNALLDESALAHRDETIAWLQKLVGPNGMHGREDEEKTLKRSRKNLRRDIADLKNVKMELMEEIEALEVKKEKLEFE